MSAVRVFVSSTCYDLSFVRESLRGFISGLGYEPVMSDYSDILYDPREHTHTSCVKAVESCDLMVLIIGGRYGGKAVREAVSVLDFETLKRELQIENLPKNSVFSITQLEFLKATECGIPVYTFIKSDVYTDHKMYQINRNNPHIDTFEFASVEKPETAKYIFEFINTVRKRSRSNSIFSFDKEVEIEETLKKQWSNYFQKLLKEQAIDSGAKGAGELIKSQEDLKNLVRKLIKESVEDNPRPAAVKTGRRCILWVDDYPIDNETVISYFKGQDVQFDLALTTEQGLERYEKNAYDLIITDMGRGSENDAGLTLIRELKKLHCQAPIIVFCSSRARERYGAQALELGAYSVTNGMGNLISLITDICGLQS